MKDSQPSFLLVDGNNIIHAWADLLELHQQKKGLAHQALIRHLKEYGDFTGDRVVVVFDGRGRTVTDEREPGGLQIFYTSSSLTADDVIERLALKYGKTYQITVATNDIPEQDLVVSAGGVAISAERLRELVEKARSQMTDWLEKRRKRQDDTR